MSQQVTGGPQRILWGRAISYGLLTEAMLIVIFIAGVTLGTPDAINIVIAVVGSFVLPLVFAMVLGRRLQARFVLVSDAGRRLLFTRGVASLIVLSRVKQARPLGERIDIWRSAVRRLIENPRTEQRFELLIAQQRNRR